MNLHEPQLRWAIGHCGLALTKSLFNDKMFTFKKGAEEFIEKASETICVDDLYPVLVKVLVEPCSQDEAANHEAAQTAWLAKRAYLRSPAGE